MTWNPSDDRFAAALLRALLDSSSQGLIGVDSTGMIQLVNRHAEQLFGYEPGGLTGQSIEMLVPERVRPIHAEERTEYSKNPQSRPMGHGIELTGRRRDGSEFPVEISLNLVPAGDGVMTLGLVVDITERVRMEERMRQSNKMEAVGQLAGTVAHELNNLLAVISECAHVEQNSHEGNAPMRSSPQEVSAVTAQASLLTRQLFVFSGGQQPEPQWFDPNGRLAQLYSQLCHVMGEHTAVELALCEDLGECLADPRQLEQVIVNLAENARDAMPAGGRLTVGTSSVEINETDDRWLLPVSTGLYIMLTVTDTGIGMTPAVQARMFEPFFTTKPQGTGMGLSLVYGLLQGCGGSIFASSKPSQGTTVQVVFPQIQSAASGVQAAESLPNNT